MASVRMKRTRKVESAIAMSAPTVSAMMRAWVSAPWSTVARSDAENCRSVTERPMRETRA